MELKARVLVTEENYREVEDKFGVKLDHLIRIKNKTELENSILRRELEKVKEENMHRERKEIMEEIEVPV